jgi:hypothetical protein
MSPVHHRSLTELRDRGRERLVVTAERLGLRRASREPSPEQLVRLLEPGIEAGAHGLAADIVRCCRAILPGLADPAASARAAATLWPDDADRLLERARRILTGRFELLGYRDLDIGLAPDWQRDPVSGRRAPLIHWSRIPYLDATAVGDHKVTWELSRQQHLVTLAQAWQLTGDERFSQAIAAHLEGWMDGNPSKRGINWASSLEVGFRAISWIWAIALAGDAIPSALVQRAAGMLHVHGRHLESHLSTWFSPNTHLTGEALALVYLGRALPMFRRSSRWEATGLAILEAEARRQVLADGVYFEQATYYHRYTTDFYLHLALLLDVAYGGRPAWLDDLLRHLLDYLAALVRPDGTWPLIGDEDGGRLAWLKSRNPNDFSDTVGLGAVLLGRPEYCSAAGGPPSELAWLLGPDGHARYDAIGTGALPAFALFPKGGYAVMRNGEGDWLMMEAGPHGALSGGHAHADALQIELAVGGTTVLEDAGTFTYVAEPEWRDAFRSGSMHSTITVDGNSAARPAGPFRWATRAEAGFTWWKSSAAFDFVSARQDGFAHGPAGLHRRELLWLRAWRCWIIRDVLERAVPFEAHFHMAPGLVIASRHHSALFRDVTANLVRLDALAETCELLVSESWHSDMYGRKEPVRALTVKVLRGAELVTVLRAGPSNFTYARDVTGTSVVLERGTERVEVTAGPAGWMIDGTPLDQYGD